VTPPRRRGFAAVTKESVTRRALPLHARRVVVSSGERPAGALPLFVALGSRKN
jgi:hypothetical protein